MDMYHCQLDFSLDIEYNIENHKDSNHLTRLKYINKNLLQFLNI